MLELIGDNPVILGSLKYGVKYTFQVELKNTTNELIHINKLYVGCHACTTVDTPKPLVYPNDTTTINIHFTPGSTGVQSKQVSVAYSSDTNKVFPDLHIKFKAFVNE